MKCTSCDSELTPGARFCDACGAQVEGSAAQPATSYASAPLFEPAARVEPATSVEPAPPSSPYDAFSPVPAAPANPAYQLPPSGDPAQSEGYANVYPGVSTPGSSGEKILGLPAEQMGNIALGLGGAGCLFSVVGCGGLISVLGLIAGFLALQTTGKRNAMIGLVLSALGIIVTLIMLCVFLLVFIQRNGN